MAYYHKQRLLWYIQVYQPLFKVNTSIAETWIFLEKYADVLATPEARTSAAMVSTEQIAGSILFP